MLGEFMSFYLSSKLRHRKKPLNQLPINENTRIKTLKTSGFYAGMALKCRVRSSNDQATIKQMAFRNPYVGSAVSKEAS